MAKNSRAVHTRIATSINARYYPEDQLQDAYYLDGRFTGKRELRAADYTTEREDRGFLYTLFAFPGEAQQRAAEAPFAPSMIRLYEACNRGNEAIDEQINDLADLAVEVTGKATLNADGKRQPYFAGVLVKEAELAAVTTGSGRAYLYRGDILYPLTESDFPIEAVDLNGNPIDRINDYSAGVAGTIRYSNIAAVQQNDCIILCNKELMETLGQREVLRLLYEADDQADAVDAMITQASAKLPGVPMQIMIALVEHISQAEKTSRLSLFTGPQDKPQVDDRASYVSAPKPQTNYAPQTQAPAPAPATEDYVEDWQPAYDENQAADNFAPANQDPYAPVDEYAEEQETTYDQDSFYDDLRQDTEPSSYDEGRRYATSGRHERQDQATGRYHQQQGREDRYAPAQRRDERAHARQDDYRDDSFYDEQGYEQNYDPAYDQSYDQNDAQAYADPYDQNYDQAYEQNYDPYYDERQDYEQRGQRGENKRANRQRGSRRDEQAAYYGDDFDRYDDDQNKKRRLILYAVAGILLLLCIFFLAKMLLSGGSSSKSQESASSTPAVSDNVFVQPGASQSSMPNNSMQSMPVNQSLPNSSESLMPGQSSSTNAIPVSTTMGAAPAQTSAGTNAQGAQKYTVASGDTVSDIAMRFYGSNDVKYINLIRDANPDLVLQDYSIFIGDELTIPAKPAQ